MSTPAQRLETVTGLMLLPLPVAAQILGLSVNRARAELPLVQLGYRTKCVSVQDIRDYIERKTIPSSTKLQIIRK
jgi:hypothetical protein